MVSVTLAIACLWGVDTRPVSYSTCTDACYETKSTAYKQCRSISPNDREARVRCFQRADQALKRCLQACK